MRLFRDDFTQEMLVQDEASRKAELAQKRKALSGAQKRMEDLDKIIQRLAISLEQELANSLNTSQSNLSNKLKRDNFSEMELNQIADILNCDFKGIFVMRDTKEEI